MPSSERHSRIEWIIAWLEACWLGCLGCAKLRAGRLCRSALVAIVALHVCYAQATTPPHWKETEYSIDANGMTLSKVLFSFGKAYGVRVSMSIPGNTVVHGRLQAPGGAEFLDRLAATYRFQWFVYSGTLYICPMDDFTTARIEVGEDAAPDAKSALMGLGLFETRFGWGELIDEGLIIVSGPKEYVNLVKGILLPDNKAKQHERQLMVFRLKYASATDREVTTRGKGEVIPGVKTILSNLLDIDRTPRKGDPEVLISSRKRSRGDDLGPGEARQVGSAGPGRAYEIDQTNTGSARDRETRLRQNDEGDVDAPGRGRRATTNQGVRIDADPTLNAILIYDRVSKRPMYQALITELDVEPQQVEIEALIVDIDRGKLSQLGAEWGYSTGNTVVRINGNKGDNKGTTLPIPGSTILIENPTNFYARLSILEGQGDAQILAKPTVLTIENVAAVLDLSQSRYVPLVGERVADIANITAGTMLKVVPRIIREENRKRIRLNIDIEDGSVDAPGQNVNTQVSRSTITTQAIIEPQHTLLIGGYHSESKTNDIQKIPLLGDIPIVGALFSNKSSNTRNRERLFLITPRLVQDSGVLASRLSHAEVESRKILAPEPPKPEPTVPPPPSNPGGTPDFRANDDISSTQPATSPPAPPPNEKPESSSVQAADSSKRSINPEFSCRRGYCSFPLPPDAYGK